ncbi:alpha-L-rhamnosidase [bacterium]|nr:MAG: alpha-L-rhamnosidase [bacterium]
MTEPTTIERLRCERLANPLGMDVAAPRLSWRLSTERKGARQVAYRVTVQDRWDSGWVENDAQLVVYGGEPIAPHETAVWNVEVRDETGATATSEEATWSRGPGEWQSEWIGGPLFGGPRTASPTPELIRGFRLDEKPTRAVLYATGLGVYRAKMDGERVGDHELAPGWTVYSKRVRYQAFELDLAEGDHEWTFELGDGWYAGHVEWRGRHLYGDRPLVKAELHLWFGDRHEVIPTDGAWDAAYGPSLQADLIMGEHVDARRGREAIVPVRPAALDIPIVHQGNEPIRAVQEIKPISIVRKGGEWLIDLGQNMVGWVRVNAKGQAGKTLRLRHGEILDAKGDIYLANLRTAEQIDYYTFRGDDEGETFEPRFTFHGFRYVQIQGLAEEPTLEDITGVVLHSDYERAGDFKCSNELVTQLQRNIEWGWWGNSLDVPTDCPQRDERLGWTGDAQVFCRTANFISDAQAFWEKYVQDLSDEQGPEGQIPPTAPNTNAVGDDGGPAWADVIAIVPWDTYEATGDAQILRAALPAMEAYLGWLDTTSDDGIRCGPNYHKFKGFGDWLNINAETPQEILGTAFAAFSADRIARSAAVVGDTELEAKARASQEKFKLAFRKRYVTEDGLVMPGTQTAYLLGLHFDLLEDRGAAIDALVTDIRQRGDRLSTGFVGSPYLNHVLTAGGRSDVAFDLLNQKQWPSWLYAVTQGATTIWERWDGWTHDRGFQDIGMNSFNHYAYGAIGDWLYRSVAGIAPGEPGYKRIEMKPQVGGDLTWAEAWHESPYGRIESSWRADGGRFIWDILVPPGVTADAHVPGRDAVCEGASESEGRFELTSGRWRIESTL